jgi:hypothetical protein
MPLENTGLGWFSFLSRSNTGNPTTKHVIRPIADAVANIATNAANENKSGNFPSTKSPNREKLNGASTPLDNPAKKHDMDMSRISDRARDNITTFNEIDVV